ncbi:MAG: homoprotocatechuate degradation operon regulator HpaR [Paracoccaceae bacterium]|nr:MAG: homoprotocatechuate degradation operon regulator HpaR [Paracoccaceae bacterium]
MDKAPHDGFQLADTRRTLPIALLRAREAVMDRFRPMLNAHGVTEQQWRVMRVLQERGPTDATALATAACVLPPSLTRMLRALESRSFITLHRDPSDGRRAKIVLTEPGRSFIAEVSPRSAEVYAAIERRFGRARIDALLDDLAALTDALRDDDAPRG